MRGAVALIVLVGLAALVIRFGLFPALDEASRAVRESAARQTAQVTPGSPR